MKRKNLLIGASFLAAVFIFFYFFGKEIKMNFCEPRSSSCWDSFNLITILLLSGPTLFVSSLAAFKASEQTFNSWKKITAYFFLAYVGILLLMPWSVGDEFAGFTKGMLGIVLSVGYTLFSCAYLLTKKK